MVKTVRKSGKKWFENIRKLPRIIRSEDLDYERPTMTAEELKKKPVRTQQFIAFIDGHRAMFPEPSDDDDSYQTKKRIWKQKAMGFEPYKTITYGEHISEAEFKAEMEAFDEKLREQLIEKTEGKIREILAVVNDN